MSSFPLFYVCNSKGKKNELIKAKKLHYITAGGIPFYTTSIMTARSISAILLSEEKRTMGPERKGNAADLYKQFKTNKSQI